MSLHDRIKLANTERREDWTDAISRASAHVQRERRIEYWEQLPQRKIGSRRDSYMDLMWVWLGLGAAILGAILAVRL